VIVIAFIAVCDVLNYTVMCF